MIILLLIILALAIFVYVISAKALAKVARHIGLSPVLAWIPLANIYLVFKAVDAKMWLCWTYIITYIINLFIPSKLDNADALFLFASLLVQIGFIVSSIYLLVVIYRLTKKYDCSTVLFWIGIILFPVQIYLYYKIGQVAEQRQIEEEKEIEFKE